MNKQRNPYPIHSPTITTSLSDNAGNDLQVFEGKPFWIWDKTKHDNEYTKTNGNCCFNHMIGLPMKNGIAHPMYDYELEFKEVIENNQHIWTKKARGIGATTFLTRYLAWRALSSNDLDGKSIFIIAGTREEFANTIKEKTEQLFDGKYQVIRDSRYTECYINNTWFKVFPSKRLKDVRGYTDVAYLFIDEADFFDPKEQNELNYVIKSYEEKSKGKIILVSTAGASGGLFEQIENDPNSDFYKHYMLVDKGRGKIFDDAFLKKQKEKDPAFFAREYEGKYGYGLGNVFLPTEIEACCYDHAVPQVNYGCSISMGIDPGFGSSKFGITIIQLEDNILKVIYAKEFDRPSYEQMIRLVTQLKVQYRPHKIYVDGSKPDFIKSIKIQFNENVNYESVIEQANRDKIDYEYRMFVIPISFNEWGKELLGRFQHVVSKTWFSVSSDEHKELVTQMRMAKFKDNGNLEKDEAGSTNTFDVFDSARLALKMIEMSERI